MRRITLAQLQHIRQEQDRPLTPDEFDAIANAPMEDDEYNELIARLRWFQRKYPTASARLAYNRRQMKRLVRPIPIRPTAMLAEAWVGKGGIRAEPRSKGSVRIVLMNVLRWTFTRFEPRRDLLLHVIRGLDLSHETVLLTPAGYFGWDTRIGDGRAPVDSADMDRSIVRHWIHTELDIPDGLFLALGLDDVDSQHIVLKERNKPAREITRGHSGWDERCHAFGGLRFFATICYEFQANEKYGPMYAGEPRYFDAERDIKGQDIDAVLNAAHIGVRCSQRENQELKRFPFERFMISVSQAGAAAFLAHHHRYEKHLDGMWKNDCYSNWGIFSGQGAPEDWMPADTPVQVVDIPLENE